MNDDKKIKMILIFLMAAAVLMTIFIVGSMGKKGNNGGKKVVVTPSVAGSDLAKSDSKITGIITGIDDKEKEITVYSVKYEDNMIFNYNGASSFKTKHGKEMAVSQISIGQIYDIGYNRENTKIVEAKESDEVWEYKKLTNFKFRDSGNEMTINGAKYKFTKGINITLDGVVIDKSKLVEGDEVTARGIGNVVWSLVVTGSHGTIKFQNYDDMLGGKVMVGNYDSVELERDTRIVVAEGIYEVQFVNGNLRGEKTVTVERNKTVTMDLSDLYMETADTSLVNFKISPESATLYVDGNQKSHSDPIELEYGEHSIKVELDGYNAYSGKQIIDESAVTVNIKLTKETIEEEEDNTSKEPVQGTQNATQAPAQTGVPTIAPVTVPPIEDVNNGGGTTTQPVVSSDESSPSKYADGSGGVG